MGQVKIFYSFKYIRQSVYEFDFTVFVFLVWFSVQFF